MYEVGYNPMLGRWIVWNTVLCRAVDGRTFDSESDAIEAMHRLESRVFSRNPVRRESYVSSVLFAA